MQKLQKIINVTALVSEASHIFCCLLPTIFTILSLLVGLGVIGAIPSELNFLHDVIHDWEIPIIITSGVIILFGWALHYYAKKMDCESMGPDHEVCEPRKQRTAKILKIATVLFVVNVSIYFLVHRPMDQHNHGPHAETGHDGHNHHGHDH